MKGLSSLRGESGQVMPLVAVTLFAIVAIMALVIDGGVLFAQRRSLQGLADGAARAGAMAIDEQKLRESGGAVVQLDPSAARSAVTSYFAEADFSGEVDVSATSESVEVRIQQGLRPILISLVGIKRIQGEASAAARPRTGTGG